MTLRTRSLDFWQQPEIVEQFAARDPDHRLVRLVDGFAHPPSVRVLDLGCAGGRNTVFLAERGFDVTALDFSPAMVEETRRRVTPLWGAEEAKIRVRRGDMDRLEEVDDGSMDLIVALGIYHAASDREEWGRTIQESNRVLARGGRILVANHGLGYDPEGTGLQPVSGERYLFDLRSGRSYLVDAPVLDRSFMEIGLFPEVPTETVCRGTDSGGRRITLNALYRKP